MATVEVGCCSIFQALVRLKGTGYLTAILRVHLSVRIGYNHLIISYTILFLSMMFPLVGKISLCPFTSETLHIQQPNRTLLYVVDSAV